MKNESNPMKKQVSVIVKGVFLPGKGIAETPPRVKRKPPPHGHHLHFPQVFTRDRFRYSFPDHTLRFSCQRPRAMVSF
jgi:hypothetical protein